MFRVVIELTDDYAIRQIGYKPGSGLNIYTACLRRTDNMIGVLAKTLDEAKQTVLNDAIAAARPTNARRE